MAKKNKIQTSEMEDFEILYKDIENKVVRERIRSAGEWYIDRAIRYKRYFYTLSVIGIIVPLLISCINILGINYGEQVRVITTVASAVVSFTTSLLTFSKVKEKWTLYRNTIELIKRELTLYAIKKENDEDLVNLVCDLEELMSEERVRWEKILQDDEESDQKTIETKEQISEFSENQESIKDKSGKFPKIDK